MGPVVSMPCGSAQQGRFEAVISRVCQPDADIGDGDEAPIGVGAKNAGGGGGDGSSLCLTAMLRYVMACPELDPSSKM